LPWMCYDGPTRSFQASFQLILLDWTRYMISCKGMEYANPMLRVSWYKGYFKAQWEGGSIRVFSHLRFGNSLRLIIITSVAEWKITLPGTKN
jgi:hypothetical protein